MIKQLDSLYDSCDSLILTLTRDEAAESDVGPGLAVNSPLRDFNLRLKIMKNVNLKKNRISAPIFSSVLLCLLCFETNILFLIVEFGITHIMQPFIDGCSI